MKKIKLIAFLLLRVGTFGLLANELILNWGRPATLVFAVANVVGFMILGYSYWVSKKR